MPPDIDKYMPKLDKFDLSPEQRVEFIHIMWRIMERFADCAFGLDPVQMLPDRHDQKIAPCGSDLIESRVQPLKQHFNANGAKLQGQ